MKQKFLRSIILLICLQISSIAFAHDLEIDGIYYKLDKANKTAKVTYKGTSSSDYDNDYSGDVVIPSTVQSGETTYSVTAIGMAFNNCTELTSIIIPNSVTSIDSYAFGNCTGLTSIIIPNSVTSIDKLSFKGCYNLTSVIVESDNTVYDSRNNCNAIIETATNTLIFGNKYTTLPESVTSIGEYAFSACKGLTSIEIPNTITSIGSYAFYGCSDLTSITIPNSVTELNNYTFWTCSNLTSITLPNSLTKIGNETFNGCTKLTSIHIPDSVKSIGNFCFVMCENLSSITIPSSCENIGSSIIRGCNKLTEVIVENENKVYDSRNNCNAIIETSSNKLIAACNNSTIPTGVTTIGKQAFSDCTNLTTINIPNTVCVIEQHAFSGCENLTNITLPNSLTTIENFAFGVCSKLTSIHIPHSVTNIGTNPFFCCPDLESIIVDSENTVYDSRQNCNAIINTSTNSLITGCKKTVIPNTVTRIDNLAFRSCLTLTNIEIPNSVTSIGPSAFLWCSGLTSITIPNSVIEIESLAFGYCESLTSIAIPNSVISIKSEAFSNCINLATLTLGKNISIIESRVFYNCPSINSINVLSPNPPIASTTTFDSSIKQEAHLYVPSGTLNLYTSATGWNQFINIEEKDFSNVEETFTNNDDNAEYYNLQGIKVDNPEKGIFIKRQGDRTTKIVK